MHLQNRPIFFSPEHLLPHGVMSNSSLLLFNEAHCSFASHTPCLLSSTLTPGSLQQLHPAKLCQHAPFPVICGNSSLLDFLGTL